MLKYGDKIALTVCSNGIAGSQMEKINLLINILQDNGFIVICSEYLYSDKFIYSTSASIRANILMDFYRDSDIKAIFDISGGDIANEILPFIDFTVIKENPKSFWGYSDLTTIINAIYCKTGCQSYLYQIKNIAGQYGRQQISDFINTVLYDSDDLYKFPLEFIQGNKMDGVIVGGNIRCLLKLAGTKYMPDFTDKLLFLESNSGDTAKMLTYLNQLQQMGVLNKIKGLLLGTFTEMDNRGYQPDIIKLVRQLMPPDLPLAKTNKIGHNADSKCLIIGKKYNFRGEISVKNNVDAV